MRLIPSLAAVLLCSTALAGCSTWESLNPFGDSQIVTDKAGLEKQVRETTPPTDLNSGVRMARELRLEGKYDEASRILSQLMLVASDDPRVVGEYGKTLLQRGRTQDAVQFLSRAAQIQSSDWTTYSALGVAYDQLGDQASAKYAYDHALTLAPNEASILSNYALSRLLANDVAGARVLAAKAASAGGAIDPKIARNIAMIEATSPPPQPSASAAPLPQVVATAVPAPVPQAAPAPRPVATATAPVTQPVPHPIDTPTAQVAAAPVKPATNPAPQLRPAATPQAVPATPGAATPVAPAPVASAAPRILMPQTANNAPPGAQQYGVVMQPVPVDPLAGPVKPKPAAAPVAIAKATPVVTTKPVVAPPVAAPVEKTAVAAPVKPADKPVQAAPVKTAAVVIPVKPEAVAPVAAKPVELAAKPADKAPVKTAMQLHDGVPALRLAADATTP